MTFEDLFKGIPGAAEFVSGMPKVWPISLLQDVYAPFGALHLVGLAMMGGAVILLSLRLMGAGLVEEQPSAMERNLRPWFIAGLLLVLGTGVIIGMLNSDKLYKSVPFFIKMISLLSACIFSFGVTNAVAKSEGKTSVSNLVWGAIAFVLWLVAVGVFSTDAISSPGVFHPIYFGYAILLIFGQRTRWIAAGAFTLLFGGMFIMFWVAGFNTYEDVYMQTAQYITIASAVILMALYGYEIFKGNAAGGTPLAKVLALFSILIWVTVAAGGRWIGFAA